MPTFEIQPGVGVGPVRLGMTRAEVEQVMGKPEHERDGRACFLGAFFVDFDEAGTVEFIELGDVDEFRAEFKGVCLHEVVAEEAVRVVSQLDQYDAKEAQRGYSYIFLGLQLSLWRGTVPDEEEQDDDDPDGRHFEAVGIARSGYFQPKA